MMYQNTTLAKRQLNVGVNKRKREGEERGRGEGRRERERMERERVERERDQAWNLGCCSSSVNLTDEMQLRADITDIIFGLMAFNVTL